MPVIARHTIDEVRRRANLVEIAGRYTALKRAGREYKGLSPFTEEKTPSFFVNPEKNVFYCYSTQEAGDVFGFVQRLENLNFQEAVEHLAEKAGVVVEYEAGGPSRREMSMRKQLFEINAQAAAYFALQFSANNDAGKAIRHYWSEERQFRLETATDVGIGLAPTDPESLIDALRKKGFAEEVLDASGLFYDRHGPKARFFPRFRGRLMVPVRDIQDRVIGFTARVTPLLPSDDRTADAKYVNSPETPLFQKRRIVFGLDRAGSVVRGSGQFLLMEGQLDVIRCWENGVREAIALQGTAAGEEQFLLLKRFSNRVNVLLDGDRAGRGAAYKLLPIGFRTGVDLQFSPLPEGSDPDDLLRKEGPQALEAIREKTYSPIQFALSHVAPNQGHMDVSARTAALEEIFGLLRLLESEVTRRDYLDEVAKYFRTDAQAVSNDYERFTQKAYTPLARAEEGKAPPSDLRLTGDVEVLLFLALQFPNIRVLLTQISICEWITEDSREAKILRRLASELFEGSFETIERFKDDCEEDEERTVIARLLVHPEELEAPEKLAQDAFNGLVRKFATAEIARLVDIINSLPVGASEIQALQARRRDLRKLSQHPPSLATTPD
ncbi:MAG: DNA primase [Verrucomicrobiota bacterium]